MSVTIRLTHMLAEAVGADVNQAVSGSTVAEVLDDLFARQPGLQGHIVDETGAIRPHVAVFVNDNRVALDTDVSDGATLYVLHAVSGG